MDVNHRSAYTSSTRSKNRSNRDPSYPINSKYRDENDEEELYEDDELGEEEEEEDEDEDEETNNQFDDQDDDGDDDGNDEEEEEEEEDVENGYDDSKRRQKKRRLESLVNNYEFAPRNPPLYARNSPVEWNDHSTSVLLEAWGDRFLQLGRKSLRSEDWQEVAEKVSEGSKMEWTEAQCRNRLDTLKKKYKKEREKMESMGGGGGYSGKWVFFKKMDALLLNASSSSSSRQQCGLPCGIDSGEYVFMNPRVYLDRSNGLDEMRDSPCESELFDDDEDSDGFPHERKGFGLLADSIEKFGEIYEKIESSKRQQMMELEKMRVDFQRELEVQKKQILERAQAEIAKIRQGDEDDETDGSAENFSG